MTGVSFTRGGYHRIGRNVTAGLGGYTVHRPGHWLFDGTGLGYGDALGAAATVVGYRVTGAASPTRRPALCDRRGRNTVDVRDPGNLPDAALHPRDLAVRRSPGCERTGVPRARVLGRVTPRRWNGSATATRCSAHSPTQPERRW